MQRASDSLTSISDAGDRSHSSSADQAPGSAENRENPSAAGNAVGRPGVTPDSQAGQVDQGQVGDALRSVYQRTVEEEVPDEMLDLLGRLG